MGERGELEIPKQMLVRLSPAQAEALSHPYRRQILRALTRQVTKLSPREVAESGLLPCSISAAGYHMAVLADAGLVKEERPVLKRGATKRWFSAQVSECARLSVFLQETVDADEQRIAEQAPL